MTVIKYHKNQLKFSLYFSLPWFAIFAYHFFYKEALSPIHYGFLFLGVVYLLLFLHQKSKHYLTLAESYIKENRPFGKKLFFDEVVSVNKFSGDLVLKSKDKKIVVNSRITNLEDFAYLEQKLKQLKLLK